MRLLVAVLAGLLAIPAASAVRAGPGSVLTISAPAQRVTFGQSLVLTGQLRGARAAGREIAVDAWPYGAAGPRRIAVVTTNPGGTWALRVRPAIQTVYQADGLTAMSPQMSVGVTPAVTVATLAGGRLQVHVAAGRSLSDRMVELQSQQADGSWTTVERAHLNSRSTATLGPLPGTTSFRVAMSVNQAGAGYLGASSRTLVNDTGPVTLSTSALTVLYAHRITIGGRVRSGEAGERVTISASPYGRPVFAIAQLTTGKDGRFSFTANPTILTAYQAHAPSGTSRRAVVDVRPLITVRELGSGRIQAHVSSATFLYGRTVQLQRLTSGGWQTVARRLLRATATATFDRMLPRSTIRVAISVNQAGAGYLGSASHALLYRGI